MSKSRIKHPGVGKGGVLRMQTHCPRGHAYTDYRNKNGYRRCLTCMEEHNRARAALMKSEVFVAYGNKCAWSGCEITDPDMLQLDHVNDNGAAERKMYGRRGGSGGISSRLFAKLKSKDFPKDDYQLLCANHNIKKEMMRRRSARA